MRQSKPYPGLVKLCYGGLPAAMSTGRRHNHDNLITAEDWYSGHNPHLQEIPLPLRERKTPPNTYAPQCCQSSRRVENIY